MIEYVDYIPTGKGRERRYNCPFCEKKTGRPDYKFHLYLNPDRDYNGVVGQFICYRCGTRGSMKYLQSVINNNEFFSSTDIDKKLFTFRYGSVLTEKQGKELEIPPTIPIVRDSEEEKYLLGRGFTQEHIVRYDLRACVGRYQNRIFIPVKENGSIVYWQARAIYDDMRPKYRNPSTKKSALLFNREQAMRHDRVIIVEGPLTAIMGGPDCIAILGKFVSRETVVYLAHSGVKEFVVALDEDARDASIKLASDLKRSNPKVGVSVFAFPRSKDTVDLGNVEFRRLLSTNTFPIEDTVLDPARVGLAYVEIAGKP